MNIFENNLKSYSYVNKYIEQLEDEEIVTEQEDRPLVNEPLYNSNRIFYLGIDLFDFDFINEMVDKMSEKSIVILWYLKPKHLNYMLGKYDFSDLDTQIIFMCGEVDDDAMMSLNSWLLKRYAYNLTNIQPIVKLRDDVEYIRSSREVLKFINDFRGNYKFQLGNDLNDTLIGIRNRIINLPKYCENPGFDEFINKHEKDLKGKPAIIVSSGPSLDLNVHQLKYYQDKVIIFSADCSLQTLEKHEIVPHFVGSVERVFVTYEVFYQNKKIPQGTTYVGPAVVRPEILDSLDQPFLSVFKERDQFGTWLDNITGGVKGSVWSGTSVAHMLTSLAHKMGCYPITLIGQDLAYTKDGVSHTASAEVIEKVDVKDVELYVESINGEQLPSTFLWKNFLSVFEAMIREDNISIIDATEGGAKITGTEIMTLKEVLEAHAKTPLIDIRKAVNEMKVSQKYFTESLLNGHQAIKDLIQLFDDLQVDLDEAIKMNAESIESLNSGLKTQEQLDKIYDSLEFVEHEIVKRISKVAQLMMMYQYPIFKVSGWINSIPEAEFTVENIHLNLHYHRAMLDIMNLYNKKALRTLLDGINGYENELRCREITFDSFEMNGYENILIDKAYEIHLD